MRDGRCRLSRAGHCKMGVNVLIKEGVCGGRYGLIKGKNVFIKYYVARKMNPSGVRVKTPIPAEIRRVTKENTTNETRMKFMFLSGG